MNPLPVLPGASPAASLAPDSASGADNAVDAAADPASAAGSFAKAMAHASTPKPASGAATNSATPSAGANLGSATRSTPARAPASSKSSPAPARAASPARVPAQGADPVPDRPSASATPAAAGDKETASVKSSARPEAPAAASASATPPPSPPELASNALAPAPTDTLAGMLQAQWAVCGPREAASEASLPEPREADGASASRGADAAARSTLSHSALGANEGLDSVEPDPTASVETDAAERSSFGAAFGLASARLGATETPAVASTIPTGAPNAAPSGAANAGPESAWLGSLAAPAPPAANGPASTTLSIGTPVGAAGFGSEMAQGLVRLTRSGVQSAEVALHPAELGPVRVDIRLDGQQATLTISAVHEAARSALQESLPQLHAMFQQSGLQLVQAQVGDGSNARQGAAGEGERSRSDASSQDPPSGSDAATPAPLPVQRLGLVDTFA